MATMEYFSLDRGLEVLLLLLRYLKQQVTQYKQHVLMDGIIPDISATKVILDTRQVEEIRRGKAPGSSSAETRAGQGREGRLS